MPNAGITSYTNASNNRVITSVDANTINAEANLTFDGTALSGSAASTSSYGVGYIDNKLGVGTLFPKAPIHIFEDNYSTTMADPIEDTRLFVSDIGGGSHIGIQSNLNNSGSIYFGHRTEIEAAKIVWDKYTKKRDNSLLLKNNSKLEKISTKLKDFYWPLYILLLSLLKGTEEYLLFIQEREEKKNLISQLE